MPGILPSSNAHGSVSGLFVVALSGLVSRSEDGESPPQQVPSIVVHSRPFGFAGGFSLDSQSSRFVGQGTLRGSLAAGRLPLPGGSLPVGRVASRARGHLPGATGQTRGAGAKRALFVRGASLRFSFWWGRSWVQLPTFCFLFCFGGDLCTKRCN